MGNAGALRSARAMLTLGIINAAIVGVYAVVSYGLVTNAPVGGREPLERLAYERLANGLAMLGTTVQRFIRGESALSDARVFTVMYGALFIASSLVFVMLLAHLAQQRAKLTPENERALFHWSVAFALLAALAAPALVQDFWASAGWGRHVARGVNPYYVPITPETTHGLPLDYRAGLMTYGPLRALVSGAVMLVARDNAFAAGLIFKALLAAAWIGSIALVRALMNERPLWERCAAVALSGWGPLGTFVVLADGHNDIVPVMMLLMWLFALERGRAIAASLALAASVLLKYLSAPLVLLDFLHVMASRRAPLIRYLPQAVAAGLLSVAIIGVFYRSPSFFQSAMHAGTWHFFTPRDAIVAAGRFLGIEPGLTSPLGMVLAAIAVAAQAVFVLWAAVAVRRYALNPDTVKFRYAILAITTALLFGVVGHVWPWYLAWALFPAALLPYTRLTRWLVGCSLAAPLALLYWVMFPTPQAPGMASLAIFVVAMLWFSTTRGLFSPNGMNRNVAIAPDVNEVLT